MREYGFFTENLYSRILYGANFRTFCDKTDNAKMGINSFEKNSFLLYQKGFTRNHCKKTSEQFDI